MIILNNATYAQSIGSNNKEFFFSSEKGRIPVKFGNLGESTQRYKVSVTKLHFDDRAVTSLLKNKNSKGKGKTLSDFYKDNKPLKIETKELSRILNIHPGKYIELNVPVFELKNKELNFYKICSTQTKMESTFIFSVCLNTVVYLKERHIQ
ncbi:hypothetical protein [Vibrio sp.]|uniref:hypothetical protein n=1 Tax=Vibrio sp. TaxID=678 RepID=UPI0031200965